jgi:lipopolysaccharide export system protein LptC
MTMGTRSAILFPLVLLSMLALLTFWINKSVQPAAPKIDGSGRHDPDYRMSNFLTTQTDINGALRYKLAAIEMKHYPDDDTTDLQRPRYTQFSANKPYTQVEGLRGQMSNNGKKVELADNVKITRQAFAGKGEMTDFLTILPNDEVVSTDRPVLIRQAPKTIIHATGMLYEKKNNTVTLLHKVRAHYERPKVGATAKKSNIRKTKSGDTSRIATKNRPGSKTQSTLQKPTASNARIRRRYE